ncbi:MAG: protein translocase subunit SecF [Patescibacteria group bacterium]
MINFTKHKNKYLTFSGILVLASILAIVVFGFNLGIEMAGGSVLEVDYDEERPQLEEVKEDLEANIDADFQIQELADDGFIIRTTETSEDLYGNMMNVLEGAREREFESIGPAVGEELKSMTLLAMILASLLVIIYIAFAFAGSSGPIASWQYGVVATVVAFLHDVLIIVGVFAVLGEFLGVQFTIPIVVALLTTLGYSLNDTVVIFDRIRENIGRATGKFEEIVDKSLNETITRSINTSLTTLLVLLAVLFFGGESLFYFILALVLGVILGTYSSIFLASSLLLKWKERA